MYKSRDWLILLVSHYWTCTTDGTIGNWVISLGMASASYWLILMKVIPRIINSRATKIYWKTNMYFILLHVNKKFFSTCTDLILLNKQNNDLINEQIPSSNVIIHTKKTITIFISCN